MSLFSHSKKQRPLVPSILREFLPDSLFLLNEEPSLSTRKRLNLIETVVKEVHTALPRIRARIGNDYLPAPPVGIEIKDLEISVRTYNCLSLHGIESDTQLISTLTINTLLKTKNFGVKSLVDLLTALEALDYDSDSRLERIVPQETVIAFSKPTKIKKQSHFPSDFILTYEDIAELEECVRNQCQIPESIRRKPIPKFSDGFKFNGLYLKKRTYNCLLNAGFIEQPERLSNVSLEFLLGLPAFGKD